MHPETDAIAVIGMACRLPGSPGLEAFWRTLVAGAEPIDFFDEAELSAAGVPEHLRRDPRYVPAAPVLPDADGFDAGLFSMTAAQAQVCDPQIRVFLETVHAALENAGHDPFGMDTSVGIFGACGPNDYFHEIAAKRPDLLAGTSGMSVYTLNSADYLATFTSYKLDLRGPSMTVLTACSGSLVAVHLAAQALRSGDCDTAVAGGASIELPLGHGHLWTPGGVLSPDGHCRPFDAAASGTIFGSGTGAVVLKRLGDALADGDRIAAVLRATVVNNDGAGKVAFTAPSVAGQSDAVREAMALAGAAPADIGYVEMHATGTALGDPIEVAALAEAYADLAAGPVPRGRTAIGSVKSNIGHMNAAAGIAGLIKTVLILDRELIVPSVNLAEPNPKMRLDETPFRVATTTEPWPRRDGSPRLAAVNSLGIGGTNAHTVLAEGPAPKHRPLDGRPRVVLWSARSAAAAGRLGHALRDHFGALPPDAFPDAAATLQHGRTSHPVRAAVVAASPTEAADAIGRRVSAPLPDSAARTVSAAFMFPGQGAHRTRMAAGLYGTVRAFSIAMDECLELFERTGLELHGAWLGDDPAKRPERVQPLLFAVEYSLAEMWRTWGVVPRAVIGHSLGELTAAAVAGVFGLADAVHLVAARAAAMADAPVEGGMVALARDAGEVAPLLSAGVVIAAENGPEQTVVSGSAEALDHFVGRLGPEVARRRLPVAHAFHHPGWKAAADRFAAAFAQVTPHVPRIPLYSGRTGARLSDAEALDARFWSGQLTRPVLFSRALDALIRDGSDLLVESGPGATLSGLAGHRAGAADARVRAVSSLPAGPGDEADVLRAAAALWAEGASIDWAAAGQERPSRRAALPGYPYERARYWVTPEHGREDAEPGETPAGQGARPTLHENAAPHVSTVEWAPSVPAGPRHDGGAGGTALVLLPADPGRAAKALLAVERSGHRTIRIRPAHAPREIEGEFRVRLDSPADLDAVLRTLDDRGVHPGLFVHAAGYAPAGPLTSATLNDRLDTTFYSALALARLALRRPPGVTPPRFAVLTSGAVDVSGGEPLCPAAASVTGLIRTLAAETPGIRATVIDASDRAGLEAVAAELAAYDPEEELVALRAGRRYLPVERPFEPRPGRDPLRPNGVYLITGGFGGLGRELARHLAGTGTRPRLVLLGRNVPAAADPVARAALSELRALEAEVLTIAADVCDPRAVRSALDAVEERFGAVHGLFHLAGVAGDTMIAFRKREDAARVMAPKTKGTVFLLEALAQRPPLDFALFFGSRAAVDGLVGGADYAAANGFLDATAQAAEPAAGRFLNIAWPVWDADGMARRDGVDVAGLAGKIAELSAPGTAVEWEDDFAPATHWLLDEHRVGGTPLFPGTGYIDLVVRLYGEKLAASPRSPVEMTDVVFRAPLADERPRRLRVVFRPSGDGHDFTVSSRPANEPGPWTGHVTGRITGCAEPAASTDLEALRRRMTGPGAEQAANAPRRLAFNLGPRWQNIAESWQAGDEKLVKISLFPAFEGDLREHRLHPALLDTATAALRSPGQGWFAPFLYRRIIVHADLPAEFFSHVRQRPSAPDTAAGDIDLIAPDGSRLVLVEGFTMRAGDFAEGWLDRLPSGGEAAGTAETAGPPQAAGLDARIGMDLLMRILSSPGPRSLVVRTGEPVPAAEPDVRPAVQNEPSRSAPPTPAPPPAPRGDDVARELARLWEQALGRPPDGDDDDFFAAGGNSLTAVDLVARVKAVLGAELAIGLLLDNRTFGGLRRAVSAAQGGERA